MSILNRLGIGLVILISIGFMALGTRAGLSRREETQSLRNVQRDFCTKTQLSLRDDARDFRDSDVLKREIALARFSESNIMYHNIDSILMCATTSGFTSTEYLDCWLNKKFSCLANLADQARASVLTGEVLK